MKLLRRFHVLAFFLGWPLDILAILFSWLRPFFSANFFCSSLFFFAHFFGFYLLPRSRRDLLTLAVIPFRFFFVAISGPPFSLVFAILFVFPGFYFWARLLCLSLERGSLFRLYRVRC